MSEDYILGAGMTGLATGLASNFPIFEARETSGGICSSYYMRPNSQEKLVEAPADREAYRFEIGGGHWIFGGDTTVLNFLNRLTPVKRYSRKSSVYFRELDLYVPYPLQNNLRYLAPEIVSKALTEITKPANSFETMEGWLEENFGSTLCELFFYPFHQLYTAGLYQKIAPQDAYKSPIKLSSVVQGAIEQAPSVGYNVTFAYPIDGLNQFSLEMANRCDVRYGKRATEIDVKNKIVYFTDGSDVSYDRLISTLPLNKTIEMTGLEIEAVPDPYTSVLVLNLGAKKGEKCPDDHWLYNPDAISGFHRVGFYSNVDKSFLPKSAREREDRVSIYVERAYPGGVKPTEAEAISYAEDVAKELQEWQYIEEVEAIDRTWIEVAYTWSNPNSSWQSQAIQALEKQEIYQVGRYARWVFQGIADSVRDGFIAGASFKKY